MNFDYQISRTDVNEKIPSGLKLLILYLYLFIKRIYFYYLLMMKFYLMIVIVKVDLNLRKFVDFNLFFLVLNSS